MASEAATLTALGAGWEITSSAPDAWASPAEAAEHGDWRSATVPGTAAGAVADDGARDFDAEDWWFRVRFEGPEVPDDARALLQLDGVATVCEVFLGGEEILRSESMYRGHELDVTDRLGEENELVIACRALRPRLVRRRRPSARWRTRVVDNGNLRWFRTMMFGRSPGFAPRPGVVGPWRPVGLQVRGPRDPYAVTVRATLDGADGRVTVGGRIGDPGARVEVAVGPHRRALECAPDGAFTGELRISAPALWWPHTHGHPERHTLTIEVDGTVRHTRQVGFRALRWAQDIARDGLALEVNGVPVFARGAVWTPADLVGMAPGAERLRELLERVHDGGMNMLRVVGTGAYETPEFHDLCDELGILVWQDLMFANLDYPFADADFEAEAEAEAREVLAGLVGRPSLAVVCGNSEVEQQAAMLGLERDLGRAPFYDERVPAILAELGGDCAYVPSTPYGGALPFHPGEGIAHYFGVTGYFRPPEDARRAGVRFAAECLAFANVPDEVDVPVHHPRWKEGVMRDAGTGWDIGSGWDFDDVRDHYLGLLFGVDPVALRRYDHERYLELSRFASGEVMAAVIGEWRRAASPCRGALVLWCKDMAPGAGLGVLDHRGLPKVAFHHLRRAFAPVAVWSTDEGIGGIEAHVANDRAEPLHATLRVATYRDFEEPVDRAEQQIDLPAHGSASFNVEDIVGRFVDAAWAYRFGEATQNLIVLTLETVNGAGGRVLSQSFVMPAGRPAREPAAARLGLTAKLCGADGPNPEVLLATRRFAYGVRIQVPGFLAEDDAFSIEPGCERHVPLRRTGERGGERGTLTALNLRGSLPVSEEAA